MADGIICRGVLNTKLLTLLEEAEKCLHWYNGTRQIWGIFTSVDAVILFARRDIHLVQLVLVIIWGRIKLRTKFTCVFRSCRNCPRRWINQAISTRNLAVISQWRCLNTPESPFHLAVRHNRLSNEEVWRKFGIWRHPSVKIRLESLSP